MTPFLIAIFFFNLSSLATGANFTQVYQWNVLNFKWPSDAIRTKTLEDKTFKAANIDPRFMAVYGTRLFFSLENSDGIPVSLVSVPTSSKYVAPPKLTPFPSWDLHGKGDCNKIEEATGLDVDSVGRLWVLDSGSDNCNTKLWIFDLNNNDHTKIIHRFPFQTLTHDLVLDETANGTFAYISRGIEDNVVVFSLERNESWIVDTPEIEVYSISLSSKNQEQLYIGKWDSKDLYSISVVALRNGAGTANPKLIGKWTAVPYRMLVDNRGIMFAAFSRANYINYWKTSHPFAEQRFHEFAELTTGMYFTFASDESGILWMTVFDNERKPKYRLLKAALGEQSFEASPDLDVASATGGTQGRTLMSSSVFFVFLLALFIL
ncbi:major royal jelly protein 5-like [Cloeon dipterum]|uniref:major royal jelly protein 5-like n=1 Tax=Cloeon dipterum TaxID=197152 RepID=UPI003220526E